MRKKIALQFVVSNLALLVNFALTVILARLLSPTDIGIFSMSAVLIAVAHVFRDFGVTTFLAQEKIISTDLMRGAIGLLVTCSWAAALVMYLSAPLWAIFFQEPKVSDVVKVLAIGFVFIPIGAIPQSLLMREMEVGKTAWVTAITTVTYFVTSIFLAFAGFKHMTMAWANLVNILVSGVVFNLVLRMQLPWKPSIYGWSRIAKFGAGNLVAALIRALDNAIPDIALGKMSTPENVGLYSRGNSTVNMIGTIIHPTIGFFAIPYLARTHHANGDLDKQILDGGSVISCLMIPPLIWVSIVAKDVVYILYGSQWLKVADVIPWLSLSVALSSLFILTAYAVTGIGKPHAVIPSLVVGLCSKFFFIWWLFDGSLYTFAMSIALGQAASIPFLLCINRYYLNIQFFPWLKKMIEPIPAWAIGGVSLYGMHEVLLPQWPMIIKLIFESILFSVVTLAIYLSMNIPIRIELLQVIKKFRS